MGAVTFYVFHSFFLKLIVISRLCVTCVRKVTVTQVIITRLIWITWPSMSAVRERLLNVITHSLSKLYLFVLLFACLGQSVCPLNLDDANPQTIFHDYIGAGIGLNVYKHIVRLREIPFWYISMGFAGVYLELDLSTACRRLKSPPGSNPIHYPIHPPILDCFPACILPSSDYTA